MSGKHLIQNQGQFLAIHLDRTSLNRVNEKQAFRGVRIVGPGKQRANRRGQGAPLHFVQKWRARVAIAARKNFGDLTAEEAQYR
jgi:hypothetical protein